MRLPISAPRDPRLYQIAVLGALTCYAMWGLALTVNWITVALVLTATVTTQYVASGWGQLPPFDARSPLISGLSLCLLLRSDSLLILALAAVLAISSKFMIRWRGKHVFNPTNFAIVILLLGSDSVWVSPGQWGHTAFFSFLLVCLGILVVQRSERGDISLAFLLSYTTVLIGRACYLGDPWTIPFNQLQSGALLIFAFFMLSDPKTTPDSRAGRICFAVLVSLVAAYFQFVLFNSNGLMYALALAAPTVPLIDHWLAGPRYQWRGASKPSIAPAQSLKQSPKQSLSLSPQ